MSLSTALRGLLLCLCCAIGFAEDGLWVGTASLANGRYGHTATLLNDGTVLVAGGQGALGALTACEIYHPATRTWTATGSMGWPHLNATALLMGDGRVLVVGGNAGDPTRCEIYSPTLGTWTATAPVPDQRVSPTVTALPDGRVLVAGGFAYAANSSLSSCLLFNPGAQTWAVTGSMQNQRSDAAATLLPDGRVLETGGSSVVNGNGAILSTSELYSPATGTWAAGPATANVHRSQQFALAFGSIIEIGGYSWPDAQATEYFNAGGGGTWSTGGDIAAPRSLFVTAPLDSRNLMIAGGGAYAGSPTGYATTEILDPFFRTWRAGPTMLAARQSATATVLPSGTVLVVGGTDSFAATPLTSCETLIRLPILNYGEIDGTVGKPLTYAIAPLHDPLSFTATGLPAGMALNPLTGAISGTPQKTGTYTASGTATNQAGTVPFTLVFAFNNGVLPKANPQHLTGYLGAPLPVTLTGSDTDGNALNYFVVNMPAHGTLIGAPPALVYQPNAGFTGTDSLTFVAKESNLTSLPATVSISIGTFTAKVNFQPASATVPAGYVPDSGLPYGPQHGLTYGWNVADPNTRQRSSKLYPDARFDTFDHMQKPDAPQASWSIAVPNGWYAIHVVSGDPDFVDSIYRLNVQGVLAVDGTPTAANHWIQSAPAFRVQVTTGQLTVTSAPGAVNNKIDFIDILQVPTGNG